MIYCTEFKKILYSPRSQIFAAAPAVPMNKPRLLVVRQQFCSSSITKTKFVMLCCMEWNQVYCIVKWTTLSTELQNILHFKCTGTGPNLNFIYCFQHDWEVVTWQFSANIILYTYTTRRYLHLAISRRFIFYRFNLNIFRNKKLRKVH